MQEEQAKETPFQSDMGKTKPTIVGIGASAGGLAALERFFASVPEQTGLSFVVVMHLSPEHESHLANLLQPLCRLPVQQVTETVALEPDSVYVIPPDHNLSAVDTHLRLSPLEDRRWERAPVDHFFRTLANTHDGDSVGVILTGTGSDGTLGLKDIKGSGGLTVVQDPDEAEFDGMPQSAISTRLVDLVLPLDQMAGEILRYVHTRPRIAMPSQGEALDEMEKSEPVELSLLAYGVLHQQMLERYAPPSILVNPDHQVVHLSEHAGRYLVHPVSNPTSNVFKLIREELRLDLRAALVGADKDGHAARTKPIALRLEGKIRHVVIHVRPPEELKDRGLTLVIFEECTQGVSTYKSPASYQDDGASPQTLEEINETLEARVEERTLQVRQLASKLTMAEQKERRRVSQILHDNLQQLLYGLQMKTRMLEEQLEAAGHRDLTAAVAETRSWLQEAIATTRQLTVDLSPPILKHEGLADAIEWLKRQMQQLHDLEIVLKTRNSPCTSNENLRVLLFQVVRELLFNVKKHAGVDRAIVELDQVDERILIRVSDSGQGFASQEMEEGHGSGFGLVSVRERLRLLGGDMEVDSAPYEGTTILLWVPATPSW